MTKVKLLYIISIINIPTRCLNVKHGFIKVAAVSTKIKVADCEYNTDCIINKMNELANTDARIIVFPEFCITGSTCGDLFFQPILLSASKNALNKIVEASVGYNAVVVVGLPFELDYKIYDCAAVIYNGKILGIVPKVNVSNNSFSDKSRYFTPAPKDTRYVNIGGQNVSFSVDQVFKCKSISDFTFGIEIGDDLYSVFPASAKHATAGATII